VKLNKGKGGKTWINWEGKLGGKIEKNLKTMGQWAKLENWAL